MTKTERIYFIKEANKKRQRKFKADPQNVASSNMERKELIKQMRKEDPDKIKQPNKKDIQAFRESQNEKKAEIDVKIKDLEAKAKKRYNRRYFR